jgi:hypothetical protein
VAIAHYLVTGKPIGHHRHIHFAILETIVTTSNFIAEIPSERPVRNRKLLGRVDKIIDAAIERVHGSRDLDRFAATVMVDSTDSERPMEIFDTRHKFG